MVDEEFYPGKSVGSYVKRSLETIIKTMLKPKPNHSFSRKVWYKAWAKYLRQTLSFMYVK